MSSPAIRIGELIPAIMARIEIAMRLEREKSAGYPQREVRR